jgi:predicted DCC family thiol-disulfide oxidoreductase YuxK
MTLDATPGAQVGAPRGWVLYDGGCGVCARWVPFWGPTLARLGLGIAALQEPWVAAWLDVPRDALLSDIRLLFVDGSHLAGADVYRYVMRRLWWASPLYALAAAPGTRRIFDAAYRRFADHRHRISTCRSRALRRRRNAGRF